MAFVHVPTTPGIRYKHCLWTEKARMVEILKIYPSKANRTDSANNVETWRLYCSPANRLAPSSLPFRPQESIWSWYWFCQQPGSCTLWHHTLSNTRPQSQSAASPPLRLSLLIKDLMKNGSKLSGWTEHEQQQHVAEFANWTVKCSAKYRNLFVIDIAQRLRERL